MLHVVCLRLPQLTLFNGTAMRWPNYTQRVGIYFCLRKSSSFVGHPCVWQSGSKLFAPFTFTGAWSRGGIAETALCHDLAQLLFAWIFVGSAWPRCLGTRRKARTVWRLPGPGAGRGPGDQLRRDQDQFGPERDRRRGGEGPGSARRLGALVFQKHSAGRRS